MPKRDSKEALMKQELPRLAKGRGFVSRAVCGTEDERGDGIDSEEFCVAAFRVKVCACEASD